MLAWTILTCKLGVNVGSRSDRKQSWVTWCACAGVGRVVRAALTRSRHRAVSALARLPVSVLLRPPVQPLTCKRGDIYDRSELFGCLIFVSSGSYYLDVSFAFFYLSFMDPALIKATFFLSATFLCLLIVQTQTEVN